MVEERRIDITDGEAYTQADFMEFYGGLVEWNMAQVAAAQDTSSGPAEGELSQSVAAVSIVDDEAAAEEAELEAERLRQRAAEEDRRADEQWRKMKEVQRLREEEAEEAAWRRAQAAKEARRSSRGASSSSNGGGSSSNQHTAPSAASAAAPLRDDDEPDAMGWSPKEQRLLEEAMRAHPPARGGGNAEEKRLRWEAIAAAVPGRTVKDVVARCRVLREAVRKVLPPPLLRLDADLQLLILERVGGAALCAIACACKELVGIAHDDSLWMPIADALPAKWAYSKRDRGDEAPWAYTLRMRDGLYGAWKKLNDHEAGLCPYLAEIGTVVRGEFRPTDGKMDYRVTYGAICELVQLQAKRDDGLSHRTYKAVAETLVALSANPRSAIPPDLHMTVREIYKTVYPGFGAGIGSGAFAPGLQAGGSSTKGSTAGTMLGKGVATMLKKVEKEETRKRLDTKHTFFNLVAH